MTNQNPTQFTNMNEIISKTFNPNYKPKLTEDQKAIAKAKETRRRIFEDE